MNARKKISRIVYALTLVIISIVVIGCNSVKNTKTEMTVEQKNFRKLWQSARKLTPEEALKLDKLVDKEPNNLDAISKWLIYNSSRWIRDAKIKKKREKIIFHLIKKHPECTILSKHYTYLHKRLNDITTAKKLWHDQFKKHPENLKILSNAAHNLLFADKKSCEKYLKKGQELEPNNPKWSIRLGTIYKYMAISSKNNKEYTKSYIEFKRAYKQTAIDKQRHILITLGEIAYILKKYKDAENYANELLKRGEKATRKYTKSTCLYSANTLLGLLALKNGETKEACKYLTKSGEIIAANKLPYFSIDMSLACMLTFKGKEKCVLQYLETIEKSSPKTNCKAYIEDMKAGVMPEYRRMAYFKYLPLIRKINTARRKKFLSIGKTLSPEEVAVLEKELAKLPEKYTYKAYGTVTKLIAYYYINKDKDKTIPEKRQLLIYRLVKYFPRYSLLAYPETWLRSGKRDKKLVELCRANIKKFRTGDACPLHKAAYQIATHDKKLAEEAFLKSYKVKPSTSEKKKILARFHSRVKANKPYMLYIK